MASVKLPFRNEVAGGFQGQQQQRLAQMGAAQANRTVDALAVLNNRAYVELAVDQSLGASAAYTTLLSTKFTTLLANGFILVTFTSSASQLTNAGNIYFRVVVDGVVKKGTRGQVAANFGLNSAITQRIPVTKGDHIVQIQWSADNNTARINGKTSPNEHAHLLVQECA